MAWPDEGWSICMIGCPRQGARNFRNHGLLLLSSPDRGGIQELNGPLFGAWLDRRRALAARAFTADMARADVHSSLTLKCEWCTSPCARPLQQKHRFISLRVEQNRRSAAFVSPPFALIRHCASAPALSISIGTILILPEDHVPLPFASYRHMRRA